MPIGALFCCSKEVKILREQFVDVKQLSAYLSVSKGLIYRLVSTNEIPYKRVGNRIIFNKNEIKNWLKKQEVKQNE